MRLDVRLHKFRIIVWRHHLNVSLKDQWLNLNTASAAMFVLAIVCFANYCSRVRKGCRPCCIEGQGGPCPDNTVPCSAAEELEASQCMRLRQIVMTCACSFVFAGLLLNIVAKSRAVPQLPRTTQAASNSEAQGRKGRKDQ